ncbi:hypothetical protein D3C72_1922470 [compost metagenome]
MVLDWVSETRTEMMRSSSITDDTSGAPAWRLRFHSGSCIPSATISSSRFWSTASCVSILSRCRLKLRKLINRAGNSRPSTTAIRNAWRSDNLPPGWE